ncbi:MAG: gamma-glutamyl-gamma-aminobutyrate hydrolase family protein [Nanoarchaeota archaeon]
MILIIEICAEELSRSEFAGAVVRALGEQIHITKHYRDVTAADIDSASRIIICGTALADNAFLSDPASFAWLATCRTPVLGICGGCEIICTAFGGTLIPSQEIGMTAINALVSGSIIGDQPFEAYALHQYAADKKNLHAFDIMAESSTCVQAIRHKTLPLVGVQFHPEVRNTDIIKRFIEAQTI